MLLIIERRRTLFKILIIFAILSIIAAGFSYSTSAKEIIQENSHGENTHDYSIDTETFFYCILEIHVIGYYITNVEYYIFCECPLPEGSDALGSFLVTDENGTTLWIKDIRGGEKEKFRCYNRNFSIQVFDSAPYIHSAIAYSFSIVARIRNPNISLIYIGAGYGVIFLTVLTIEILLRRKKIDES